MVRDLNEQLLFVWIRSLAGDSQNSKPKSNLNFRFKQNSFCCVRSHQFLPIFYFCLTSPKLYLKIGKLNSPVFFLKRFVKTNNKFIANYLLAFVAALLMKNCVGSGDITGPMAFFSLFGLAMEAMKASDNDFMYFGAYLSA